ncbi:MAG: SufD family Fe-S cluster assembly protein [Candidatus Micrarchaeia archaeon]
MDVNAIHEVPAQAARLSRESGEPAFLSSFRLACAGEYAKKAGSLQGKDRQEALGKIESIGIRPESLKAEKYAVPAGDAKTLSMLVKKLSSTVSGWKVEELYLGALFCLARGLGNCAGESAGGRITLNFAKYSGRAPVEESFSFEITEDDKSPACFLNLIGIGDGASARIGLLKSNTGRKPLAVCSKILVGKGARAHIDSWEFGDGRIISTASSALESQGAKNSFSCAFFGYGGADFDIDATAMHNAAGTENEIFAKGALDGRARCHYSGLLGVAKKASGSTTDFREKVLMLSEQATSVAVPSLDIKDNEVTAGHGAAAGKIGQDELFYLKTRGVSEEAAKGMIARGFVHEALARMGGYNRKLFEQKLATRLGEI